MESRLPIALLLGLFAAGSAAGQEQFATSPDRAGGTEWPSYGGDPGALRYVPLEQIDADNVASLEVAWTYQTGDVSAGSKEIPSTTAFEGTPLLVDETLYLCTPFNRVIALDPETGAERWSHDPEIDLSGWYANQLICRGVAIWLDDKREPDEPCARRVFTATNDARLIALDAASGEPCRDFGTGGEVKLDGDVGKIRWQGEYQVTSPPAVIGDRVVVGSAISDNSRVDAPSGVVRAFDARTGALRWAWDVAPPDHPRPAGTPYVLGTPNVWAPMSVDEGRDLLFVPTGNPSPDYYRGAEPRLDLYGSSVVALRGSTGAVVWHFQTVHHDLWDFDVSSQPTLATLHHDGRPVPAVLQATKMGLLFVLNRVTGEPLFGVEERPVPQSGAPGQKLSPTQPFPRKPPPLVRHEFGADDAWGLTPLDRWWCRSAFEELHWEGIYTPPSLEPTLMYPGNAGGSNWGGIAVDPVRQLAIANVSDFAWLVTLIPAEDYERERDANPGVEISPQRGTPYAMRREAWLSPLGLPCSSPPWGKLVAVDLRGGSIRWEVPLGTTRDMTPLPFGIRYGMPNIGGPLVTASGLVFIGAAMDNYLRAFDIETGEELWAGRLPAGGQATPMSYRSSKTGKQYVVIAAGGHGRAGTLLGDSLVAFALPD